MNNQSIIIIGGGGHAKVLIDSLRINNNYKIIGIIESNPAKMGENILDIPIIGDDNFLLKNYSFSEVKLINAVGSITSTEERARIYQKFKQLNYHFLSVIHPSAYIGYGVTLGEGIQVMAGSIIQAGCAIGNNVIINTHSTVDHDCCIGDHVHLAPSVTCCGGVTIGKNSQVGCGAIVIQNVNIGEQSLIAAGAVVLHDIREGGKVCGMPARYMEKI